MISSCNKPCLTGHNSDSVYFRVLCWECPLETHSHISVVAHTFNTDILYSHKLRGLVEKCCLLPLGPWVKPSLGSNEKWAECLMDNSPLLRTTARSWHGWQCLLRRGLDSYPSVINNFTFNSSSLPFSVPTLLPPLHFATFKSSVFQGRLLRS